MFAKIAVSASLAVGMFLSSNSDLLSANKSKEVKPIEMNNFDNAHITKYF